MINPVNSTTVNTTSTVTGPAAATTTPPEENQPPATPLAEWPPNTPEPANRTNPDFLRDDHPLAGVVQEDGSRLLPDGTTKPPSGPTNHPAGTVEFADGSHRLPDGVLHRSDGFIEHPDGRVQDPDGFVYSPNGSMDHVDNTDGTKSYTKDRSGMIHIFDSDPPVIDASTNPPITANPRSTELPFDAAGLEPDGRIKYPDGSIRDAGGGVQRGDILTHADGREENLKDGTITDPITNITTDRPRFVVTALGGGKFSIGGKEVNIENLFLHITNELSTGVQADMKEKTEDLQIKNAAVARLNEYISKLSEMRGHMKDTDGVWLSRARSVTSDLNKGDIEETQLQAKENAKLFKDLGSFPLSGTMDDDGNITWSNASGDVEDFGLPGSSKTVKLYTDSYYNGDADNAADGGWNNVKPPNEGRGEGDIFTYTNHDGKDNTPDIRIETFIAHGGQVYDYKVNGSQMDAYIQKLKGKVEELNSNTQLEMIDLQELVSQNNRHYDMASNIISKAGSNRQTIAGNIRA